MVAPPRFEKPFRVHHSKPRTPLEVKRDGAGADTSTVAELKVLCGGATRRQRTARRRCAAGPHGRSPRGRRGVVAVASGTVRDRDSKSEEGRRG